jgi:hypothetical protein
MPANSTFASSSCWRVAAHSFGWSVKVFCLIPGGLAGGPNPKLFVNSIVTAIPKFLNVATEYLSKTRALPGRRRH